MPRFVNIKSQDGAIGECADCGWRIYDYKQMFYHKCSDRNTQHAREGTNDTTSGTNQQSVARTPRTT